MEEIKKVNDKESKRKNKLIKNAETNVFETKSILHRTTKNTKQWEIMSN